MLDYFCVPVVVLRSTSASDVIPGSTIALAIVQARVVSSASVKPTGATAKHTVPRFSMHKDNIGVDCVVAHIKTTK